MTLIVDTYRRDIQSGAIAETYFPQEPGREMAGLEIYRTMLWSSEAIIKRGAKFLPCLSRWDLYVDSQELDAFEAECRQLIDQAEEVVVEMGEFTDKEAGIRSLRHYLQNFLLAIAHARNIGEGAGVYIG